MREEGGKGAWGIRRGEGGSVDLVLGEDRRIDPEQGEKGKLHHFKLEKRKKEGATMNCGDV